MLKQDFYRKAMAEGSFKKRAWVISAFSTISEEFNAWMKDPYPYRIVQTPTAYFFIDPEKDSQLSPLEGCVLGEPPFQFKQAIEMKAGSVPNLSKDIVSTYGNVFFNYCCIVHAFGNKLAFMEGDVNISKIENLLADKMEDDSSDLPNPIYTSEYIKFVNSVSYLTNFTQLCVWAATYKSMTPPPGVAEFKKTLLDKYKGQLDDPAIIALIDAELVKFDAAYLKGDPSENFLISGKSRNIVRKKLFLMAGAEAGLSEGIKVDLIENSLVEGWQIEKFPQMNNSLRAGSYNRGAQTQLGGESVKWLLRASSNIAVTELDCGSKLGRKFVATQDNIKKLIGFSVIKPAGPELVNDIDDAGKYLGTTIMVRSPMFCKLDKTDYCLVCVGKRLAQNPTGVSMAVSELGSTFLSLFMKKMHGTVIALAKLDFKSSIT